MKKLTILLVVMGILMVSPVTYALKHQPKHHGKRHYVADVCMCYPQTKHHENRCVCYPYYEYY